LFSGPKLNYRRNTTRVTIKTVVKEVIKVLTEDVKALTIVDRKQPQKDGGEATEYERLV